MPTIEEISKSVNDYLKEKKNYELSFIELEARLAARKNLLLQIDESAKNRQRDLENADDAVDKKESDRIAKIFARENAVKLREDVASNVEQSNRQKVNELESRTSEVSVRESNVAKREMEAEDKFDRMEDFLNQAKEMLEKFK